VTRAAVYTRISSDDGTAAGVARQEADCRELAERKGWTVGEVYCDNDVSAYSGRTRPAYKRLLVDMEAGVVDAVVVWHLDRLHRSPAELERFFEVVDRAGVSKLATVTGDVDLGTHDGRFHARILGAVARKESDDKSRRLRRKHLELAHAGKSSGGGRAFGWEADRVTLNLDEAELVQEAARRVLAGESLRGVCADWNARGIKTVTGTTWSTTVLRRVVTAWRTCGVRAVGKDTGNTRSSPVATAQWPAILDRATVERLRTLLLDPDRRVNRSARRYLLTGMVRCGLCGARLVARPRSDKSRCYVCATGPGFSGCGKIRVLAEPLEALVVEAVMLRLDSPDLAKVIAELAHEPEGEDLGQAITEGENRLAELAEEWASGNITRAEWMAARNAIERRLEVARRNLARSTRTTALGGFLGAPGALRAAWPDLPLDRQRAVLGAVVDRVTVGPAVRGRNRFDPERVDVTWRA
jgi:site-specific DNA recombinase